MQEKDVSLQRQTFKNNKTMKRTMLIALLSLLTAAAAMAQYPRTRYRRPVPPPRPAYRDVPAYRNDYRTPLSNATYYGLRLGLNIGSVRSDDHFLSDGSAKSGLNMGVAVGFQVAPLLPVYMETGLLYTEKGGKGKADGHSFSYSLNYLELPFVLKYMHPLGHLLSLQPFTGVYVAAGVGGKMKDFNQRQAYSSFDDEGFKRFDAGLRIGCGLQFANLYTEMGYDLGLANISHDYFDTSRTGCFFATMGVNF
jgi:hypothetical protein